MTEQIETKEQWEDIKQDIKSDISTQHEKRLVKLIEALREVARDAAAIDDAYKTISAEALAQLLPGSMMLAALNSSIDAIPHWLLEEELPPLPDPPEPSSVF